MHCFFAFLTLKSASFVAYGSTAFESWQARESLFMEQEVQGVFLCRPHVSTDYCEAVNMLILLSKSLCNAQITDIAS